MDKKLIQRAATKYQQWMVAKSQRSPCAFQKVVERHLGKVLLEMGQIETWSKRFFRGQTPRVRHGLLSPGVYRNIATDMIPNLGTDTINSINIVIETLQKIVGENTISPLSLREAIEEITVITEAWQKVKFRNDILSVLISGVSLSDENQEVYLGDFWISLNLTNPTEGLKIDSIDQISPENYSYYHPHVSTTNILCVGEGDESMQMALYQGRLEDYFRIAEIILRTYNKKSPYKELSEWYDPSREDQFFCETCEEWHDNNDMCYCEECQTGCCESCGEYGDCCNDCGEWRCKECGLICGDCGKLFCNGCLRECPGCGDFYCLSCMSQCAICDHDYCKACTTPCDQCGDAICETCKFECEVCGNHYCPNCEGQECKDCGKLICGECKTKCHECKNTLCSECKQKCCNECGRELCDICSKRDCGCLLAKTN